MLAVIGLIGAVAVAGTVAVVMLKKK
jgi:hypothetical protein